MNKLLGVLSIIHRPLSIVREELRARFAVVHEGGERRQDG
jgi:hypothetical protein